MVDGRVYDGGCPVVVADPQRTENEMSEMEPMVPLPLQVWGMNDDSVDENGKTTLRGWFEHFTTSTGEVPTDVVLGWGDREYRNHGWPEWDRWGLVTVFDHLPDAILDRGFDSGYGGTDSPDLCAWSPSWVLFSDQYDGAENLCWVPRNPADHHPCRPGGG